MKRRSFPVLVALVLVLTSIGPFGDVRAQTPPKKILRVAFVAAASSLDPALSGDFMSSAVVAHIFEALYRTTRWRGRSKSSP